MGLDTENNEIFYEPSGNNYHFELPIGDSTFSGFVNSNLIDHMEAFHFLPHNHSFYELQFVMEGPAFVRIENDEYLACQDSLCIIHPFEYHTYLHPRDPSRKYTLATIAFSIKNLSQGKYQGMDIAAAIMNLNRTYNIPDMSGSLKSLFMELNEEVNNRQPGYKAAIESLLKTLLLRIFRSVLPDAAGSAGVLKERGRTIIIDRFFALNYPRTASITDLSKGLNVSERRTNQLIHELYGCSFSEKLARTRIEVAKLFLSYSDYGIAEISMACGFPSANFFYKTFHKQNGCTPGEYRKNRPGRFTEEITYSLHL